MSAEAAWAKYRDEQRKTRSWADPQRVGRQLRKGSFVAGYLAGKADEARWRTAVIEVLEALERGNEICDVVNGRTVAGRFRRALGEKVTP